MKMVLVSRLVGDGEGQTQSRVFIYGTAPVPAAHPTDWSKPCNKSNKTLQPHAIISRRKNQSCSTSVMGCAGITYQTLAMKIRNSFGSPPHFDCKFSLDLVLFSVVV